MSPKSYVNQIVLFGDSLTQFGYGEKGVSAQLAHHFTRRFDVVNRGFSGYNTEWAVQMAHLTLPEVKRMKLFIVWLGVDPARTLSTDRIADRRLQKANDCLLPPSPRAVELEKYKTNLARIISFVPPGVPVIIASPPAYSEKGKAKDWKLEYYPGIPLDRDPAHNMRYYDKAKELANELDSSGDRKGTVAFCDTRTPMEEGALKICPGDLQEGLFKYLHDGVHLTPDGYQVVYDEMLRTIQERFPELEKEPTLFDDFEEVDHAHPEQYFDTMV